LGLERRCAFVPAMSKSRLRRYQNAADLVIDQISLGEYGTLALESMALARPTMLYYKYGGDLPILNVSNARDAAAAMLRVIEAPEEAAELGRRARDWVRARHAPEVVVPRFVSVIEAVLEGQEIPQFPIIMQ